MQPEKDNVGPENDRKFSSNKKLINFDFLFTSNVGLSILFCE